MSRMIRVSDEVWAALHILKVYPSWTFNEIIKALLESAFPGDFFEGISETDRILLRDAINMDTTKREILKKTIQLEKKWRKKKS